MMKIAIDCGHGYVKGLSESGGRVVFPSLISPAPAGVDLGEFGKSEVTRIDGQPFLVGEPARAYAAPLWSREKSADADTLRLILVATAMLGASGPVVMATGLPLSWFGSQKKAFRESLLGYGGTVQLAEKPAQRLWIESVKVLPQGAAAAIATLTGPVTSTETWLILDVGYRTSDYLIVQRYSSSPIEIKTDQAGSLENGMHSAVQTLVRACEATYHLPFGESELEAAHHITVRGERITLSPLRQQAQDTLSARIHDELRLRLGEQLDRLDGVLVTGGGGQALYPALQPLFGVCQLASDSQWANAKGYLSILRM